MDYKLIAPPNPLLTPIEQVLANRGIPIPNISHYLNTTDADNLSYDLLDNIKAGAQLLIKHLNDDKNIWIIVD